MDEAFDDLTDREKRDALSKLLLARITGARRPHPLAYSQQSRWALTMSSGGSAVENHAFAWKLRTRVEPDALRQAVAALLERHACLRSVFGDYDRRTVRFVVDDADTPFTVVDRTTATRDEVAAELAQEASRPFDLRTGPVLRVCLLQTERDGQTLMLTAHHIAADFTSLAIALRSLAGIYARVVAGAPIDRTSDEDEYDRFVVWEAKNVLGEPGRRALAHWGREFADGLDFVALPVDRPWPASRGFRDAERRFTVPGALVEPLRKAGQERDCTLFAVMLALFHVLIHTYTRQTTIAAIVPVSIRSHLSFERLVGALGNHLLVRSHVDGRASFAEFLLQVREALVRGLAHRDFPASLGTRRVRVRGVPEGAVPFPIKFNMPAAGILKSDVVMSGGADPRLTLALGSLTAELEIVDRRVTGNCELNMGCLETPAGLLGTLQYNLELFDEETIAEMVGRLGHLAMLAGRDPSMTIDALCHACSVQTT